MDFERLLWKNCDKVRSKEQYFPIHVTQPLMMKDLYVYVATSEKPWKIIINRNFTRNASEFSSKFYELVYRSDTKL